jgi:hypothetical protein
MNLNLDLLPGRLLLLIAPAPESRKIMMELIARLALRGPLEVMDGGNRFDAYHLARLVRRQTHDLNAVLKRIRLARAFTCYQMLALLEQAAKLEQRALPHARAASPPRVILDLLDTFYDDSVAVSESLRLLQEGIGCLRQLSRASTLAVSARPPPAGQLERLPLLEALQEAAGELFILEPPSSPPPLRLF